MRQPSSLRGSTGELLCSFFFEVFCGMRAFVTVGSTQFDELIMAVDDEGVQKVSLWFLPLARWTGPKISSPKQKVLRMVGTSWHRSK